MAQQVRLRIGVALIGPGAVRNNSLVEALLKLAAQAGDAPFGFFRELLLRSTVLDRAHVFAHLKFEVLEQRGQFGLKLAHAVAHFNIALAFQPFPLLIERVLLLARRFALDFELCKLAVQFVEEARDVGLLRAQAFTRGRDDRGVQSQSLRRLNSSRSAGHAKMKLVVGNQCQLVHAGRGIAHAGRVGRVDLEGCVMRRD